MMSFQKSTLFLFFFCLQLGSILAQSPCNLANTNACTPITLDIRLPSNRVFCEGQSINIINNTTDAVDTTFYCWGDGKFTAVPGNGGVTKSYDFPDDTCTTNGSTSVEINIIAIKRCGTGMRVTNAKFDITILYKPTASFVVTTPVCVGSPVTFSRDRRYCPNGSDAKFSLDFGDGSPLDTSSLPSTHTYSAVRSYTATFTITNGCGTSSFPQTIVNQPLPVVKPTLSINNLCAPASLVVAANGQFINSPRWSVRNSTGSVTSQDNENATFALNQTGLYTISLEARGCSNRLVKWDTTVRLIGAPLFRLDSIEGDCGSVTLRPSQLLTLSDTTVRSVLWRFTGPNLNDSSTQRLPPDRVFTAFGTYTVSFSAANSCTSTVRSFTFSVDTLRQARIVPVNRLCNSDAPINLQSNFLGGQWSINNTASSNSFNPRTALLGDNLVIYTLGRGTCRTADTAVVKVGGSIVNAGLDVSVCSSEPTIRLPRATPVGGVWRGIGVIDSINGIVQTNLITNGTSLIRYTVKDTANCVNFDDIAVRVAALPAAPLGSRSNFCINEPFIFNENGDRSLTYEWNFGDGTNSTAVSPSHTFTTAGAYTIRLTVRTPQGCVDSIARPVEVGERGKALVTASNTEGCGTMLNVQFTNRSTGTGLRFNWVYGNGQTDTVRQPARDIVFKQANRDTIYRITLKASNGCGSDSAFVDVTVKAKPNARFGTDFNSNCSPMTVNLSNVSVGQPRSYRWFADGILFSTDSAPAPQVYRVFNNLSPRTVRLVLITENGCGIDSIVKMVQVVPPTTRAFFNTDTTIGCAPFKVTFTNFSTVGARVKWTVSNGDEDTSQDTFAYIFRTAGIFTVWQYATNGCGYDSTKVQIEVKPAPTLGFESLPAVCLGDSIRFRDTSINVGIGQWSFGDSLFSTARNPVHLYQQAGTFNVQFKAVSLSNGCSATANGTVVVRPLPLARIGVSDSVGCPPLSIQFDALTSARQVTWFFDSINTSNQRQPRFPFNKSGRFPIKLLVEDNFGCRNTATFNDIIVFDKPQARFNLQASPRCGLPASSAIQNNSIGGNTFEWTTNNGQNSVLRTPIFTFNTEGSQTVTLIVENTVGCRDTNRQTAHTYTKPIAQFTTAPNQICERQGVAFTNLSQFFTSSSWSFGDGTSDTTTNTSHKYNQSGIYRPQLIVGNKGVCFDTLTLTRGINVYPSPKADFSFSEILDPKPQGIVQFTDLSRQAISWRWLFSNQDTSLERNPRYQFRLNGTTTARLAVQSVNGCVDTLIKSLNLTPFYGIYAPNVFAPNQIWGDGSLFKPKGRGLKTYTVKVFSAFGEILWESSALTDAGEPSESWDGTFRGQPMPQGAYAYLIQATYITSENVVKKGTVTLLR